MIAPEVLGEVKCGSSNQEGAGNDVRNIHDRQQWIAESLFEW